MLSALRRRPWSLTRSWSRICANAAGVARLSLQQSFPAASLIPGRNVNPLSASLSNEWHFFINLYARYVFNDITLDGNYSGDSHSVTLTNEQAFISAGVSWHNDRWGVVASVQDSRKSMITAG